MLVLAILSVVFQEHAFNIGRREYLTVNPIWYWRFGTDTAPGYDPVRRTKVIVTTKHDGCFDIITPADQPAVQAQSDNEREVYNLGTGN